RRRRRPGARSLRRRARGSAASPRRRHVPDQWRIAMSPKPKRSPARVIPLVLVVGGLAWYGVHRWRLAHAPFEWSGTVEARTIDLGSRAGGRIKQIVVKEGDRVKAGDPLIVLEPGDWPAQ